MGGENANISNIGRHPGIWSDSVVEPAISSWSTGRSACPGEDQHQNGLTEKLALLFKETQALSQVQVLTEAEIAAEIAAYRSGQ